MRSACPHSGWPIRPRPSVAAEANPARLSLVELDVGDLLCGHQDRTAALISDYEELVVREGSGERLLDILHRGFGLDHELARSHLYADLDFHRDPPLDEAAQRSCLQHSQRLTGTSLFGRAAIR